MHEESFVIPSDGATLAATLTLPSAGQRSPAVLVLGSHPKHGGERRGDVGRALHQALTGAGFATLRLDYRGVGESSGSPSKGDAEATDAIEALSALSLHAAVDGARLGIAGYSFGGAVALDTAARSELAQAIVAVACPMRKLADTASAEVLTPKLIVGAELDHDLPWDQFSFLARRLSQPREVEVVYGADHFFSEHSDELTGLVAERFKRRLL